MMSSEEDVIVEIRANFDHWADQLYMTLVRMCPGTHSPVQHRDGKKPWCNACGRDYRGFRIGKPREPLTKGDDGIQRDTPHDRR